MPMRFVTAVQNNYPEMLSKVIEELWHSLFVNKIWVDSHEKLENICRRLELPTDLVKDIDNESVKQKLKDNTDEAIRKGAFGVPYVVLYKQGQTHHFFGVESFPQLCYILNVHMSAEDAAKKTVHFTTDKGMCQETPIPSILQFFSHFL
ncbi:unnamed protein product [Bursaphelenchus okinawaensis]|uniref:DSBA-like thioredoxin domain-containing protein n=1 Tax=Bursaphelenchus okinawaensis TaxID=465554 RepID=A0A811LH60_9BILA|nr:unnamed protein product [Bursaphelenchus okinawaensis]CAG9122288.1 unnamed protein product [Bursaphelenchus okinawaensis]